MIIPMQEIARLSNKELDAPYPDFSMVGVKITKRIKLKLSDVHIDDGYVIVQDYEGYI